jgi:hypothetical protein
MVTPSSDTMFERYGGLPFVSRFALDFHDRVGSAYDAYLARTRTIDKPPEIGERWPREGYYDPALVRAPRVAEHRRAPAALR